MLNTLYIVKERDARVGGYTVRTQPRRSYSLILAFFATRAQAKSFIAGGAK